MSDPKITVHVERRAVCPGCGSVFESHRIPAHHVAGRPPCPATERDARKSVVVFRRDGAELAVVEDGTELSGFFTANEGDGFVADETVPQPR